MHCLNILASHSEMSRSILSQRMRAPIEIQLPPNNRILHRPGWHYQVKHALSEPIPSSIRNSYPPLHPSVISQ